MLSMTVRGSCHAARTENRVANPINSLPLFFAVVLHGILDRKFGTRLRLGKAPDEFGILLCAMLALSEYVQLESSARLD